MPLTFNSSTVTIPQPINIGAGNAVDINSGTVAISSLPAIDIAAGNAVDINNISGGTVSINNTVATQSTDNSLYSNTVNYTSGNGTYTTVSYSTSSSPQSHAVLLEIDVQTSTSWAGSSNAYVQASVWIGSNTLGPPIATSAKLNPIGNGTDLLRVLSVVLPTSFVSEKITVVYYAQTAGGPAGQNWTTNITGYTASTPANNNSNISANGIFLADSVAPANYGYGINIVNANTTYTIAPPGGFNFIIRTLWSTGPCSFQVLDNNGNATQIGYLGASGTIPSVNHLAMADGGLNVNSTSAGIYAGYTATLLNYGTTY